MEDVGSEDGGNQTSYSFDLTRIETQEDLRLELGALSLALSEGRVPTELGRLYVDMLGLWMDSWSKQKLTKQAEAIGEKLSDLEPDTRPWE